MNRVISVPKKRRVLFLSHDIAPCGAPRSLLAIMEYLHSSKNWEKQIIIRENGASCLANAFRRIASIHYYHAEVCMASSVAEILKGLKTWNFRGTIKPGLRFLYRRIKQMQIIAKMKLWDPDIVYSNTAMNGDIIEILYNQCLPIIVHVRELETFLSKLDQRRLESFIKIPVVYLAVSSAVKNNLVERYGIEAGKIVIVSPSISVHNVIVMSNRMDDEVIRRHLGIPVDASIIGAVGTIDRRKGYDLFVETATKVIKKAAPRNKIIFLWIGNGVEIANMKRLVSASGFANAFRILGYIDNPYPYMKTIDLLFMSSRDDPFPRVNLEAAALSKPIVAFKDSGGSAEFIGSDCGFTVEGFDSDRMSQKILELILNRDLRNDFGKRAAAKVRSYYDTEIIGKKIAAIIEENFHSILLESIRR